MLFAITLICAMSASTITACSLLCLEHTCKAQSGEKLVGSKASIVQFVFLALRMLASHSRSFKSWALSRLIRSYDPLNCFQLNGDSLDHLLRYMRWFKAWLTITNPHGVLWPSKDWNPGLVIPRLALSPHHHTGFPRGV